MVEAVVRALTGIHERDPREEIWDLLRGYADKFRVGDTDVLVARYVRSGRVKSRPDAPGEGLLIADQTKDNDTWLSCSGLIIKVGSSAFDGIKRWNEETRPKVNDWVLIDPKLGKMFHLGPRICFLVPGEWVFAVLKEPDIVQ